jgi:hypothetical protein
MHGHETPTADAAYDSDHVSYLSKQGKQLAEANKHQRTHMKARDMHVSQLADKMRLTSVEDKQGQPVSSNSATIGCRVPATQRKLVAPD